MRTSKGGSRGSTRPEATRRFPGVIGTAITKIRDNEIARTGLSEREAKASGFAYETARIEGTTRSSYYPGAEKITIKALIEKITDGSSARRSSARRARPSAST